MSTEENRATNVIIALAGLGAGVQAYGLDNPWGAIAFVSVGAYSAWQATRKDPNNIAPLLLAGAAFSFTAESIAQSVQSFHHDGLDSMSFWRDATKTFGGVGGVIGDVTLRLKRDFQSVSGGVQGATVATLRNPAFWYSLCAFGIGMSALLAKPGLLAGVLLLGSVGCAAMSIVVSTHRFLQAARREIAEEDINNGVSNLWGARSLPLLTATYIVGATQDPKLLIAAAGCLILTCKEMLLTRQFNPRILFGNIVTPLTRAQIVPKVS